MTDDFNLQLLNLNSKQDVDIYTKALNTFSERNPYYKIDFIYTFSSGLEYCYAFVLRSLTNEPITLMPFYLKPIKDSIEDIQYYDVLSTYGYSGPLYESKTQESTLVTFWNLVDTWYKENYVVSEFIRFSLNKNFLGYTGHLKETLQNIKGNLEAAGITENYDRKVRKNIRKAEREDISAVVYREDITPEIFDAFYNIYIDTMQRKEANNGFYFSRENVRDFITNFPKIIAIAIAYFEDKPVASELILCSKSEVFSFIGGTKSEYFNKRPNDLLKHSIILWAKNQGFKNFILGGGYGSDDGIFKYKKAFFPNDVVKYFTGRKVINPEIYNTLVMLKLGIESNAINYMTDYFPNYHSGEANHVGEIKEITTKSEWAKALDYVDNYDFYHTYDYHSISCAQDEEPLLLIYETKGIVILLPLVLRPIPNTEYYDFTSVYGYAGPISNVEDLEDSEREKFQTILNQYLIDRKIVSVFSRLHPYIDQCQILKNLGSVIDLGQVVNIDVTLPLDESRRAYSKSNKNQINKLRRQCTVVKAQTKEDVLEFVDIYYENMKRLDAEEHYFFSKEYFLNFMNITDFQTDILLVRDNETNTYIAGSMFVKTKNTVQFHLSGTRTDFLRQKPSKLFLDEMRVQATEQGYKIFNLGGGLGSEQDSLFEFKASFSKDFRTFNVWKHVVNQEVYNELSKDKDETCYFPKYRS